MATRHIVCLILLSGCSRLTSTETLDASGPGDGGAMVALQACGPSTACSAGFECITRTDQMDAVCLGAFGALCSSDAECVSGTCLQPHDCHAPTDCAGFVRTCGQGYTAGQACGADADCGSGHCEKTAAASTSGACCSGEKQQCSGDGDCCAGLSCATDNTGCRVGPTPVCVIDGVTYASGASNPSNEACQYCDPYTSPNAWKDTGSYAHCGGAGFFCCKGVCSDALCQP